MSSNILKTYREKQRMSRKQLAALLQCSVSLVQLIECGHRAITPINAVAWEAATGIPREDLCPAIFAKAA
jgi:transcriptional regulator with XRE-family HTH domain